MKSNRDIQEVRLQGPLVRAPEVRYTTTGKAVANLSIATNYKDGTEFHNVIAWEDIAEMLKGLEKGDPIKVTGRL